MTDLRTVVAETWERALEEERSVTIPDVADRVIATYPEIVEADARALVRASIIRLIKDLARSETEESSQLSLFGFPSVIAVPVPDDGYVYMQAAKARWDDLSAGALIREVNVRRAQERLDQYAAALTRVRPFMEGTLRTLAEALAEIGPGKAA